MLEMIPADHVWEPFGSRKALIDHHNKLWKSARTVDGEPDSCLLLLREEDFD